MLILQALIPSKADAFETRLSADSVLQGDPFVLTVTVEGKKASRTAPKADFEGSELLFGSCGEGCFIAIAAVGLDASPGQHTVKVKAGSETRSVPLTVNEGVFPVQRLTLPEDKVTLSPEDEKRADREAGKLRELWGRASDRLWQGGFIMPLDNDHSTAFGAKRIMNDVKNSIHSGLDIRGAMGEKVRAANTGRVVLAEELFFGGNTLVLDHGQGIYTIYMHLSGFNASVGQLVEKGSVIGFVGATGRSTGPHLHFGVKVNTTNVNPVAMSRLPLPGGDAVADSDSRGADRGSGGAGY